MSKRKGRSQPRSSEIKSVMRAPTNGEEELVATSSDPDGEDGEERIAASEDELEALGFGSDDDAGEASAEAAEAEPEQSRIAEALPQRRRLRAVRGRETAVAPAAMASETEPDTDQAFDRRAMARWGDDGGQCADADDFLVFPLKGELADDEDAGGQSFPRPSGEDSVEGDDTEGFLRGLVEALLFTSQKPLELKELARSAGVDKARARELVEQLARSYEGRGLSIEQVAGGYVMRSSPRYAPYVQKILALRPVRLSRAQLETLAIVAYRQPVTKPEVDEIRGVDSGQVIKGLLERSLLKMLGKKDEPGRPTLYGTTNDFLELLNLQSLKDLPTLREYTELSEESQRKFLDETGEAAPSDAMSFERAGATPEADGVVSGADGDTPDAHAAGSQGEDGSEEPEQRAGSDEAVDDDEDSVATAVDGARDMDEDVAATDGDRENTASEEASADHDIGDEDAVHDEDDDADVEDDGDVDEDEVRAETPSAAATRDDDNTAVDDDDLDDDTVDVDDDDDDDEDDDTVDEDDDEDDDTVDEDDDEDDDTVDEGDDDEDDDTVDEDEVVDEVNGNELADDRNGKRSAADDAREDEDEDDEDVEDEDEDDEDVEDVEDDTDEDVDEDVRDEEK